MASINGFDFSKYDVGGTQKGDKAGDKKLTGDEAKKARADGWTVWDGFIEGDKVEHVDNNDNKSALWQGLRNMFNMHSSDSYIKFNELKNKIIEQKMAEQGIYPWKHGDDNIWDCDSKEYQIAEQEAEVEARKKLVLSKNTFDTGMKIIPKSIISDKSKEKNDANQKPSILGSMNNEVLNHCKKEISELMNKKLIRKNKSPWSCSAFYVNKNAEIERGTPRLVINYKPLNDALKWIRYPIPNKKDLLSRLHNAIFFFKI